MVDIKNRKVYYYIFLQCQFIFYFLDLTFMTEQGFVTLWGD